MSQKYTIEYINQKIAERAYKIWQETGSTDQYRNWVQAEYDMRLQFSDQEIAERAYRMRHNAHNPKKSDEHYWFEALNDMKKTAYSAHSEEGVMERELESVRRQKESDERCTCDVSGSGNCSEHYMELY